MLEQIALFTVAATVITVTPGADMALVARRALEDGPRAAATTSFGVVSGLLVHATAATIGVAAILARSAVAFGLLKIAGACYLAVLGVLSFRSARRRSAEPHGSGRRGGTRSRKAAYAQGLLNNVLNPKPAFFYLAFLPQFIRPGDPVLLMTAIMVGIHIGIGIVWLLTWGQLVSRSRGLLTKPSWRARLDRVTGTVLIAFGVRLATATR